MSGVRILKFGGSSVADAARIGRVAGLVAEARAAGPVVVVVSALGGVTDRLLAAAAHAAAHDAGWRGDWEALAARHRDTLDGLGLAAAEGAAVGAVIDGLFSDLEGLLHGTFLLREVSPRTRDAILSFGERASAPLVAAALRARGVPAEALDARRSLVSDDAFGRARVDLEASRPRVRAAVAAVAGVPVVTGFVAATPRGETTTLGRGGSDTTASLLGALLEAEAVELWTDVPGVMSADPRLVPEAFPLPRLSYAELMELSHFGAKVVHPPSVHPARAAGIPLLIKNTLDPAAPGTRVAVEPAPNPHPVRGIASIHRLTLLRLEGDGLVGVPGIAARLFAALAGAGVNVILITQGSSEHSISFAVAPEDAEAARAAADREFALERRVGLVEPLVVDEDQAVLAAVGEGMRERPGLAARLFGALAEAGINVRAVAQGSSELNVSVVVAAADEAAALRAVHRTFFPEAVGGAAGHPEGGSAAVAESSAPAAPVAIVATPVAEAAAIEPSPAPAPPFVPGERIPVAVLGATGTVGQRFVSLLAEHPWFHLVAVTGSERTVGRRYGEAVGWHLPGPVPAAAAGLVVGETAPGLPARLVFSALGTDVAGPAETAFAAAGHFVVSNASSHRMDPRVPLVVPEVNPDHLDLVTAQGFPGGGAIVTNPNCSTIGLALALAPLHAAFGIEAVSVVTLQALSGAGLPGVPSLQLMDNLLPFIGGEEEKLEHETGKILGRLEGGAVRPAAFAVSAACNRVPVLDGHTECVAVRLARPVAPAEAAAVLRGWRPAATRGLPSAPDLPVEVTDLDDRPQPRLDRDRGSGMAATVGRLRACPLFGLKMVVLSHNTVRGAAGGALLVAELAVARGLVPGAAQPTIAQAAEAR